MKTQCDACGDALPEDLWKQDNEKAYCVGCTEFYGPMDDFLAEYEDADNDPDILELLQNQQGDDNDA